MIYSTVANANGQTAYVLKNDGNFFLLIETKNGGKKEYLLRAASSTFTTEKDEVYSFPLYDFSCGYNGVGCFTVSAKSYETDKDWQFFKSFYTEVGESYCQINENDKQILVKAVVQTTVYNDKTNAHEAKRALSNGYSIKLSFAAGKGRNTLTVDLI